MAHILSYSVIGIEKLEKVSDIKKTVRDLEEVDDCEFNVDTKCLRVRVYESSEYETTTKKIRSAIRLNGNYSVIDHKQSTTIIDKLPDSVQKKAFSIKKESRQINVVSAKDKNSYTYYKKRVTIVFLLTLPFLVDFGFSLFGVNINKLIFDSNSFSVFDISIDPIGIIKVLLSAVIIFWGGKDFFINAFLELKKNKLNTDMLLAIGTASEWIFSTLVTLLPQLFGGIQTEVFFVSSVLIVLFILIGRLLETRIQIQVTPIENHLRELQPSEAKVLKYNEEVVLPIHSVVAGDIVIVEPKTVIPADGLILEGSTNIDESLLTGNLNPVKRSVGQKVFAATVNATNTFKFKVQEIGNQTILAQIAKLVNTKQHSSHGFLRLHDKVAHRLIPYIVTSATCVFLFWVFISPILDITSGSINAIRLASYIAVSIMIVACPGAVTMASPTAILLGKRKAKSLGITLKNPEILEILNKIDTVVFDKTGTLTNGVVSVEEFVTVGKEFRELLLSYAKLLTLESANIPINIAIDKFCEQSGLPTDKLDTTIVIPNEGTSAMIGNYAVSLGNQRFFQTSNIPISNKFRDLNERHTHEGKIVLFISINKVCKGMFVLNDPLKEAAISTINQLKAAKKDIVLLTGDNERSAKYIGDKLDIVEVIAEVSPQEKVKVIKKLKAEGRFVAMIGESVNDSAALTEAHVGIAMNTNLDFVRDSGDILIDSSLERLMNVFKISRSTYTAIKQNLFLAYIYNIIAIPVAAGVLFPNFDILMSPTIVLLVFTLSIVSVILNSTRVYLLK